MNITIKLSGTAGDGIQSIGDILTDGSALSGLHVFNFRSYGAEIRARGNSDATVRISTESIHSLEREIDVLLAIQSKAAVDWADSMKKGGLVIYDTAPKRPIATEESITAHVRPDVRLLGVPITPIAQEITGSARGKNVAALGAAVSVLKLPKTKYRKALSNFWARKGEAFVRANLKVFDRGFAYAEEHYAHIRKRALTTDNKAMKVYSGNQALSQAMVDAGCSVFAGYPITPASAILEHAAKEIPKRGGRVIQTEDEIAAIGVVLGASFAGARAMTATAGPGLSLMVEQLGLSYMTEVPCVIVCVQRGGPSTGLPTKTEQSDLNLAIFGGHGDTGRIVIAPTNVKECYSTMVKAFEYAQRYQMPVILLSDFFLAYRRESIQTNFEKPRVKNTLVKPRTSELKPYTRFKVTENGISPMSVPGMENGYYTTTGLEHDEHGTPAYTAEVHETQSAKRLRKLKTAEKEISDVTILGSSKAEIGIITWGSTTGAVTEAMHLAKKEGIPVKIFKTNVIWPLPRKELIKFEKSVKKIIIPEMNQQGQYANLLHFLDHRKIIRANFITGIPVTPHCILDHIKKVNDVL